MFTLSTPFRYEEEIKNSRFIVHAAPVKTIDAAFQFLDQVKELQATHNCWAYRIGAEYRFSDDGEPGGTAGRPILSAIERLELDEIIVVVVRYFGGVKLGAGGLVRAYGGTAARCLQNAEKKPFQKWVQGEVMVPFELLGAIYYLIDQTHSEKRSEAYEAEGVRLQIDLPEDNLNHFSQTLHTLSRGKLSIKLI